MSTRHQKSFVVAAFVALLITISASAAAEGAHNLILIIPEALPADGINQRNAPALARLRSQGVTFANSHAGFPRLAPAGSFADASDLAAESLLAAASDYHAPPLIVDGGEATELQRLVTTTLPQAKAANQPFFIVYQWKEPTGLDNTQGEKDLRPAFKPDPRAVDDALDAIETKLKELGLFDTTNIVVAAEHAYSRVLKTSNTSLAISRLPRESTLGVMPPGFLAIDLRAALRLDNPKLEVFDTDAGDSFVDADNGGHPKQGNAIIAEDFLPSRPYVTVEAHGAYDSVFLADSIPKGERRAMARVILDTVLAQDYLGGVFVNEKRLGLFRGALPMSHIARHGERDELPDIVVVFATYHERCAPAQGCISVVADTPLVEGEGIANPFTRAGTATFMVARGPDFRAGVITRAPASNADMSRTIAELLDLDVDPEIVRDARVLREALTGKANRAPPQAASQTLTSTPTIEGLVTELHLQTLGDALYLDSAVSSRQEQLAAEVDRPLWNWHWPFKEFSITISDKNN
jgi:hypothetical protein